MTPRSGRRGRPRIRLLALLACGLLGLSILAASSATQARVSGKAGLIAYVTNAEDEGSTPGVGSVIPVDLTNGKPGAPIKFGRGAGTNDVMVTSNGKTAYVTNEGTNSVVPITLATRKKGKAIRHGCSALRRGRKRVSGRR